jgi:hypothetical protein
MDERIEKAEDEKPAKKKGRKPVPAKGYQNEEAADQRSRAEINTGRGTHNR